MIRVAFVGRLGHAYIALQSLPTVTEAKLVGYAPVPPEETLAAFDGWRDKMPSDARGYERYEDLIEKERPDLVQVSGDGAQPLERTAGKGGEREPVHPETLLRAHAC